MRDFIDSQRLEQSQDKAALLGSYKIIGIVDAVLYAL